MYMFVILSPLGKHQSRTQSNACARARMALALGKLNFSCAVIGLTCMPTKPEPLNLGVPVVNFPRANAILARAQALLWVRDWASIEQTGNKMRPTITGTREPLSILI